MTKDLSTLSVLHYVYGALICASGIAALVIVGMGVLVGSDLFQENPPPQWLGTTLQALGTALFVLVELWGLMVVLSGWWLAQRRNRTASMVVAALCLLNFPLGTVLGVLTLSALSNEEVRLSYEDPSRQWR